jgi:transposase
MGAFFVVIFIKRNSNYLYNENLISSKGFINTCLMLGTEATGKHCAVMHRFFYKASHSRFMNIISLKCEHLGIVLVVYSGMLQQYTSAENTG